MIEEIVQAFLIEKLPVPVLMEQPENRPAEYVLLDKVGGGERNHIPSATVAIQSYAGSLYRAAQLNEEVKTAMREIVGLPEISSVSLNSDYDFTDTVRKRYRYQAVYDLVYF